MSEKQLNTATKRVPKAYNVKPKAIHYRAVKKLVENGGNVSRAMVEAGYSKQTAKAPQKLTESKGFQIAMRELGLTDELLVSSLVEDIKRKENRLGELTLGFKLKGHLRDTVQDNKTLILITSGESATRYQTPTLDNPTSSLSDEEE